MNPQVSGDLSALYPSEYSPFAAASATSPRTGIAGFVRNVPGVGPFLREAMSVTMIDDWVASELSPKSRWLDVGCGNGAFLRRVRDRIGCDVVGIDVDRRAVEAARTAGIDVHLGTIDDAPYTRGQFDVVSGWWYLEHVPNPVEAAVKIATLLNDGGLCILAVPNVASLNARAFRTRWYHLDCPRHLTLWSPATMRRLYARNGLAIERIRYDKSTWGLRGSLEYLGVRLPPRLSSVLLPWTITAGLLHLSDTIVVYGRKGPRR